ncbi:hypothetical protein ACTA71_006931 [Dictyostelium dimigraforme]
MTIFLLFSLYLLFFNISYIYCIYINIDIKLFIDFNLTIANYQNYECGGSLKIDQNNRQINDSTYPPCISFEHAILRAKLFFEDPKRDEKTNYINVSLKLLLLDSIDWKSNIIKSTMGISSFKYYCLLEINVLNKPKQIITIDGEDSKFSFLNYQGLELGEPYCDPFQSTRVKLSNLNFINWGDTPILLIENDQPSQKRSPIKIELNSITTNKSNKFLISKQFHINSQINIIISNCTFKNSFLLSYPLILSNNYISIYDINIESITLFDTSIFSFNFYRDSIINRFHFNNNSFLSQSSLININNYKDEINDFKISNFNFKNSKLNNFSFLETSSFDINFKLKIENISIDSSNLLNEIKIKLKNNNNNNNNNHIHFIGFKISKELNSKSILYCNNTFLNFDIHSTFSILNSQQLNIKGSNNRLFFDDSITNTIKNEIDIVEIEKIILNDCLNCVIFKNYDIDEASSDEKKIKFNIILIIPISIVGLLLIILIIGLVFRKRIKKEFLRKKETSIDGGVGGNINKNYNNENDGDITEGEIISNLEIPIQI